MDRDSILQCVTDIVRDVLMLEDRPIRPDDRFFADLGGESIDLLEVEFRIQKEFGATVSFSKLLAGGEARPGPDGRVPPEALQQLADRFSFLPIHRLPAQPRPADMLDLLTIATIASLVEASPREERGCAGPRPSVV